MEIGGMRAFATGRAEAIPGPAAVSVRDVVKRYGSATALGGVSLDIGDNEFFTLLGPSGCGKTTLLRCIAGFEAVSEGAILLYGADIAALPPNLRPVNTVFQHYALFPHMTVAENVAFGLRMKRVDAAARARRTAEMLETVHLSAFADRKPAQLSGGQQQRVALARALAPAPKVLLLDEPLSALDLKLRQAMRVELKALQEQTGITFVFVTHDQEEALTMSDRIAVMRAGAVQQIGAPRAIYEAPANRFVAEFIGETNLVPARIVATVDGVARCQLPGGGEIACPAPEAAPGAALHLSVRPERLGLVAPGAGEMQATVERTIYLGTDLQVQVRLDDGAAMAVRLQNAARTATPEPGARTGIAIEPGAARLVAD
jgi:spermidine/putrescine transport system ATP-binding protein